MRQQDSPFEWLDLHRIVNAPLPAPKYDPFGTKHYQLDN
jgi:hypothetical protein